MSSGIPQGDLGYKANTSEEAMKVNVCYPDSRAKYEAGLLATAAKQVVFKNCLDVCEVDKTKFKAFNK